MKVGTLTFHHTPSYGALLQAYALSKYLASLGHEVQVIDYLPAHQRAALRKKLYATWSWRRGGLNTRNLIHLRNKWVFDYVSQRYLRKTNKKYRSLTELQLDPPDFDVCFFGSDQIWNCEITGGEYDGAYFGCFGSEKMRRASYAASFGKEDIGERKEQLAAYLAKLDDISVRESSAADVVRAYSDKQPVQVLDPTFLIEPNQYPRVNRMEVPDKFILSYFLVDSVESRAVVSSAREELGLPVVDVNSGSHLLGRSVRVAPAELVELFRNAHYVVTDSFHGVALSLIFQVSFTAVNLSGKIKDRVVRVTDLLSRVELLDRYVDTRSPGAVEAIDFDLVPWNEVEQRLTVMKAESKGFIAQVLTG